jgi:DNA-directed RNA polymerase subunit RPC12/RpoP
MPAVLKCAGCGKVLKEWETMPNPGYYEELYQSLNGRCPFCGHELPQPRELSGKMQVEMRGVSS